MIVSELLITNCLFNERNERCVAVEIGDSMLDCLGNVCNSSNRLSRMFDVADVFDESVDDGVAGVTCMIVCGSIRSAS